MDMDEELGSLGHEERQDILRMKNIRLPRAEKLRHGEEVPAIPIARREGYDLDIRPSFRSELFLYSPDLIRICLIGEEEELRLMFELHELPREIPENHLIPRPFLSEQADIDRDNHNLEVRDFRVFRELGNKRGDGPDEDREKHPQ